METMTESHDLSITMNLPSEGTNLQLDKIELRLNCMVYGAGTNLQLDKIELSRCCEKQNIPGQGDPRTTKIRVYLLLSKNITCANSSHN